MKRYYSLFLIFIIVSPIYFSDIFLYRDQNLGWTRTVLPFYESLAVNEKYDEATGKSGRYLIDADNISKTLFNLQYNKAKHVSYIDYDVRHKIDKKITEIYSETEKDVSIPVIIVLMQQPQWELSLKIKKEFISELEATAVEDVSNPTEFLSTIDSITHNMRFELYLRGKSVLDSIQESMVEKIHNLSGRVSYTFVFINAIVAMLNFYAIKELSDDPEVAAIYYDIRIHSLLDVSTYAIYADTFWDNGINGTPYEVAILDTGVDKTHPALSGRVLDEASFVDFDYDGMPDESPDDQNGHGTHCAGIVASNDATYRGVSYGAYIINAKCLAKNGTGSFSWMMKAAEWAVTGAVDDADVISTSLGAIDTADGKSFVAKFVDAFVDYYWVPWVTAAGNEGPDSYTIDVPGDAYNCITVGAVDDRGTKSRGDDIIADFSSRGPTDDGRIKPDVVAPGVSIKSCNYDWEGGWGLNPDFVDKSGTSMATPHVAGAVALLLSMYFLYGIPNLYYAHLGAKALLINFADDYGDYGPDCDYGFGYINLDALFYYLYWYYTDVIVDEIYPDEPVYYVVYLLEGELFKATLTWTRSVRYYSSYEDYDVHYISDIDLYVMDSNMNLVACSISSIDNVEQVEFIAPTSGYYIIEVYPYNISDYSDVFSMATTVYASRNNAPVLNIYSPNNGSYVSDVVNIVAECSDNDDYIDRVEFYVDEYLIYVDYSYPYKYSWTTASYSEGEHSIYVVAYDNFNISSYRKIVVYVDNTPPILDIGGIANNSYISGDLVFDISIYDENLNSLNLYIDDYLVNSWMNSGSYNYTFDSNEYNDGQHVLEFIAIDKAGNNVKYSYRIFVDNTAPKISILHPQNNSDVSGTININVSIEAKISGLKEAKIFINGTEVFSSAESQFSYKWNTEQYIDGKYIIEILAIDNAGNKEKTKIIISVCNKKLLLGTIFTISVVTIVSIIALIFIYYSKKRR
ncbi:MAG: S8 family serine peptidase [Candidatus Njordarchaeota archaeon]